MSESELQEPRRKIRFAYIVTAVAISCLMIGTSMGVMIKAGTPISTPTIIQPGSSVAGYDYIVFLDSNSTYVKSGKTGEIVESETSHHRSIQWALNNLPTAGGAVRLQNGTYWIDDRLYINRSHVSFHGSGPATVLVPLKSTMSSELLRSSGNSIVTTDHNIGFLTFNMKNRTNVFGWHGEEMSSTNVIHDCVFWNGASVYGCLDPSNSKQNVITNNVFKFCKIAIYLTGHYNLYGNLITNNQFFSCTFGVMVDSISGVTISNNMIQASAYGVYVYGSYNESQPAIISNNNINITGSSSYSNIAGIYFREYTAGYGHPSNITVMGNTVVSSATSATTDYTHGILLIQGSRDISLIGNNIAACHYGIRIFDTVRTVVSSNRITGWTYYGLAIDVPVVSSTDIRVTNNLFTGVGTAAIRVAASNDKVTIEGNDFTYATTPIGQNLGTNEVVRFNRNYVTEKAATATITGSVNSVTVTHGLVTTPTIVIVTGNNTGFGNYYVTSKGATTFTISFENQPGAQTWAFDWYAQTW